MASGSAASVLKRWGALATRVRREEVVPSWDPARQLTRAALAHAHSEVKRIETLIAQSERLLRPLTDPLRLKFALNRWLANDREEAYSDWLAWVLEEVGTAQAVAYLLFGPSLPAPLGGVSASCHCDREVWVPTGHLDRTGRLDCVIRFAQEAIIVVEVKVRGAESSDTVKQRGYTQWLRQQPQPLKYAVLIAVTGNPAKEYEDFTLTLWEDMCRRLRVLMPKLILERGMTVAAGILSFAGAIETNLVGLPPLHWLGVGVRPTVALEWLTYFDAVATHLERALAQEKA